MNDASETRAIKAAFGDYAYKLAISSPSRWSAISLAAPARSVRSVLAVHHRRHPADDSASKIRTHDLDYTPLASASRRFGGGRQGFGFGGQNGSVIFRKYQP